MKKFWITGIILAIAAGTIISTAIAITNSRHRENPATSTADLRSNGTAFQQTTTINNILDGQLDIARFENHGHTYILFRHLSRTSAFTGNVLHDPDCPHPSHGREEPADIQTLISCEFDNLRQNMKALNIVEPESPQNVEQYTNNKETYIIGDASQVRWYIENHPHISYQGLFEVEERNGYRNVSGGRPNLNRTRLESLRRQQPYGIPSPEVKRYHDQLPVLYFAIIRNS